MIKLVVSDIHLINSPNEEWRFKIFDILTEIINKQNVTSLIILGDLTESKDKHTSQFIDRIITSFKKLQSNCKRITTINFLCGNHDYIDPEYPFFKFLKDLSFSDIDFNVIFNEFKIIDNDLYIPYMLNPIEVLQNNPSLVYDNLFLHHMFTGIRLRSGYKAEGIDSIKLKEQIPIDNIFSGHIHQAQIFNGITYIGAPYATEFRDENKGRVLLINNNTYTYISLPRILHKIVLDISNVGDINNYQLLQGDHVKVELNLDRNECIKHKEIITQIKNVLKEKEVQLVSLNTKIIDTIDIQQTIKQSDINKNLDKYSIVKDFCTTKQLGYNYLDEALQILED